ncbi:MAG: hypothetical protein WBA88_17220 [Pseudaminobacter sp.]
MLVVAETLVQRASLSQTVEDLFAAVLATVHAIEWDSTWRSEDRRSFLLRHPIADVLRQIGNGMKHAEKRSGSLHPRDLHHRNIKWEDRDFWGNAGGERLIWLVEIDDQWRVVTTLCQSLIQDLMKELANRAPDY